MAVTALVVAVVPLGDAGAQTAAVAGEPPGFVPGEATAQATTLVLGLSPGGGKPIEIALGRSTARYQNRTATSEGSALALGLLQIFFGPTSACGDRPPIIPADQLPPTTTGDSRRTTAMGAPLEVRSPGYSGTANEPGVPGGVIGTQIANATPAPQASTAATTTVSQDYGVLAVDNGATTVTTRLENGVRTATATMTATRIRVMGDMVVINNPKWEATTTSGGTEASQATFTFASATILGIDRTPANFPNDFADFANGVAGFLGGLGVTLQYPRVVNEPGRITMTPLVVGLANPPIGLDFIKPLLNQLAPLKEENTRNLIAEDCNNQAILQIADLALGILSGTGALSVSAGGVTAFTAATVFPDPPALEVPDLGIAPLADTAPLVTVPPVSVADRSTSRSSSSSSFGSGSDIGSIGTDLGSPALPPLVDAALPEAVAPPVDAAPAEPQFDLPTPTLINRRYEPGTKGGAAALVGVLGLVGLLALAGADRFVMKRTKKEMAD